jgi:glutathione S-transferase
MKLYGRRNSINVQKVLWCLDETGCIEGRDFERIDAGLAFGVIDTPEYRRLNPNGLVPTLVDGDFVVWESNTILRYLAARQGHATLLPAGLRGRADVERWMDWQLGALWASLRLSFLGLTRTSEPQRDYAQIRAAFDAASRLLAIADAQLAHRPFLAGTEFTLADIVVALPVHRWLALARDYPERCGDVRDLPALQAWYAGVTSRAGFQRATS